MGRARDLANILSSSGSVALDSELGLSLITPTSIAATGGSGTISTTGAVSFTSASAISLNGCFTSTYDNYRIIFSPTSFSADNVDISMRYRVSGVDTSSNYHGTRIYAYATSIGVDTNHMGTDEIFCGTSDKDYADESASIIESINPNKANKTKTFVNIVGWFGTIFYQQLNNNVHQANTQFDGLTIFPSGGTMTGTVRVYGYRN